MQLYDEFSDCQDYSAIHTLAGSHINRFIPFGSLPMSIKSLHSSIWLTLRFCFCCCSNNYNFFFALFSFRETFDSRAVCKNYFKLQNLWKSDVASTHSSVVIKVSLFFSNNISAKVKNYTCFLAFLRIWFQCKRLEFAVRGKITTMSTFRVYECMREFD